MNTDPALISRSDPAPRLPSMAGRISGARLRAILRERPNSGLG